MQAVTQTWHKKNYSKRIWGHRRQLSEDLRSNITDGLQRGLSIDKMTRRLEERCEVSKSNAKRLVRTELNYVHNQATIKAYKEYAGIEKYRFLATLDFKTSKICQKLDLKVFLVSEAVVGENMPPMHPHCRSIIIPDFDGADIGTRLAKLADGSYYSVPYDTTYKQWFDSLSEQQQKEILLARKEARNHNTDKKQLKQYQKVLGKDTIFGDMQDKDSPKGLAAFQEIKYTDSKKWAELKKQYRADNRINYTLTNDEKYAVNQYVSFNSYPLNEKLRNGEKLSAIDKTMVKSLDSALNKVPEYKGLVNRSLTLSGDGLEKFLTDHQVGKTKDYKAYTSFTKAVNYDSTANVQMYINSTKGRDLSKYNPAESEVLFQRGFKFKVTDMETINGTYHFLLEELD